MIHRARTIALSLAMSAAVLLAPRGADACSPAEFGDCPDPLLASLQAGTIPANAPALPFADRVRPSPSTGFELWEADAVVATTTVADPVHPGGKLLVPSSPLVAGRTYELKWSQACAENGTNTRTFTVGAAAPLPTALGTVKVGQVRHETNNSCEAPGTDFAIIELALTPSEALRPFLPVTKISGNVDEGLAQLYTAPEYYGTYVTEPITLAVRARCNPSLKSSSGNMLTEGKHTVRIEGVIAGASAPLAPIDVDVDITCDTSTAARYSSDGAPEGNETGAEPASVTSSCAVTVMTSSHGGASPWTALAASAAAVTVLAARTRRRR